MPLGIVCVPATDGVAVSPCGTVEGVGHTPVMQELPVSGGTFSFDQGADLVAASLTAVIAIYLVGLVVGSIIRIVKSA